MNAPPSLEFRVLAGNQRGCRVPLHRGRYRAGSDATCDLLLDDGDGSEGILFELHVGEDNLELDALAPGLNRAGTPLQGRSPLESGQIFSLGDASFAVDDPAQPWPEADGATRGMAASEPPPPDRPPTTESTVDTSGATSPVAAPAPPSRTRRTLHAPFWVWWLGGTALFIAVGCSLLLGAATSARTPPAHEQPAPTTPATLASAVEAMRTNGELQLTLQPDGRTLLSGYVQTNAQRIELARTARAVDPRVRLDVETDEAMAALARDTLDRVAATEAGISVGSMHFGKLHLAGPVPSTQQDGLAVALLADVPGLHWVFEEASKDGDARARENFRGASLQRDDVVLSVGGAVPYVVLANGDKQGRANPR